MIQLIRPNAPTVMTEDFIDNGVNQFIQNGSSVWNIDEIKTTLSEMSGGKCAYCELKLGEGAAYLEVEHFYSKQHHAQRVLEWENLLPSCRRCNGKKGNWDVAAHDQMLVDPVLMNPTDHIRLDEAYRPSGLTLEGQNTVVEIGLDDIHRLGVLRYKLGESFKRKLEDLHMRYVDLPPGATARQRRSIIRSIKAALEMCRCDQPFSAVIATVLMRNANYATLKAAMMAAGEWDLELENDHLTAATSSLA